MVAGALSLPSLWRVVALLLLEEILGALHPHLHPLVEIVLREFLASPSCSCYLTLQGDFVLTPSLLEARWSLYIGLFPHSSPYECGILLLYSPYILLIYIAIYAIPPTLLFGVVILDYTLLMYWPMLFHA